MRYKLPQPCLALALLASGLAVRPAGAVTITILEDSPQAYRGTFALTGAEHAYFLFTPALQPTNFNHFPAAVSQLEPANLYLARSTTSRPGSSGPFNTSSIFTSNPGGDSRLATRGNPDDAFAQFSNEVAFGPLTLSGTYTNSLPLISAGPGTQVFSGPVDWELANLADTGGADGTFSGTFSFRLSSTATDEAGAGDDAVAPSHRLANRSARARVTGDSIPLIKGFVVTGASARTVLVRAAGPGLAAFGLGDTLAAPSLTVFDASGRNIASNTGWSRAANAAEISATAARVGAFPFASDSGDAALLVRLEPGSYTAQVAGTPGTAGVAMMEIYDAEPAEAASRSKLNLSTRGQVGAEGNRLISGFVVDGPPARKILLRAIGPSLRSFGVADALAEPKIELFDARGNLIAETTGAWSLTQGDEIRTAGTRTGAFALEGTSKDAAMVVDLGAGAYTVQVSGLGGTTGTALVEVYDVP